MAFDLEEQEQLAAIKASWNKYGTAVMTVVLVALLVVVGYKGWTFYSVHQAAKAGALYEQEMSEVTARNVTKVARIVEDIRANYPRTIYAAMSAMAAAKLQFDLNDLNGAKSQLQWVLDKSGNADYRALARIRMAGIMLDQKDYGAGLALLQEKMPAEFDGAVQNRRGDILVAQNNLEDARAAYKKALEKLGPDDNAVRSLIQLKLDALGTTPSA